MEPANAEARFDRAVTYMQMGKYKLAVDDYDSFIGLKPDYADAYTYRGISYYYQGKYSLCYRDALRASKLGNDELLEIFKEDMTPL
jgi:lipoprotein NlpI